jgi:glyoxylase-like metal-dependent hydrolase (beta-lactamase superfamily II)
MGTKALTRGIEQLDFLVAALCGVVLLNLLRAYDMRSTGSKGGPYLGFPTSHDVYGDGSIVAVPAPGHTPGSVIIFVTLYNETRYALVGDLVWQLGGITLREERS